MSNSYIAAALRQEVIKRANDCCEYCLINTQDKAVDFAIDHIIAEKHGGLTESENLCLSCYWCNSFKGSDISSIDWAQDKAVIALYHPRQQVWDEHFQLAQAEIIGLTATGRVTVFLLQLNSTERIKERNLLLKLGVYPCRINS